MKKGILISVALLAAVSSVQAGGPSNLSSMSPPAQTGHWYVGAGINYGGTTSFDNDTGTDYNGNDASWAAYVGRQVNEWLAFETGYTSVGDVSFENGDLLDGTWSIDAQGVFSHSLYQAGSVDFCGLVTTGISYLNAQGDEPGGSSNDAKYQGFVWTYGAGLEAHLTSLKNVTLRADWRRYSLDSGWENVRYINDVISGKVSYMFS